MSNDSPSAPRARRLLTRARAWCKPKIEGLRPGAAAWRAAAIAAATAGVLLTTLYGVLLDTGLGTFVDGLIGFVVGLLGVAVLTALSLAGVALARLLPKLVVAAVLGGMLMVIALPASLSGDDPFDPFLLLTASLVPFEALAGLGVGVSVIRKPGKTALQKALTFAVLLSPMAANIAFVAWLAGAGSDAHLVEPETRGAAPPALTAPNPAAPGPLTVKTVFYGSSTDKRRPEREGRVDIETAPVDASLILPDLKGFKARMRRWYWGFDKDRLPLNGRAWVPEGEGPFPLVVVVHGNYTMERRSDHGYDYLGQLLASRGFITVSIDENFLNESWSGDLNATEMPARAWILLEHLRLFRGWSADPKSPFFRKIDLQNIALVGHSRGGEAAALATTFNRLSHYPENAKLAFDYHFPIRSVIAIAPSNDFYKPAGRSVTVEDASYFVLQGGHDSDVSHFMGVRQFQRVKFAPDAYGFRASLYIYRANHGQFNTVWGAKDRDGFLAYLLNLKALMSGEDQREVAKVYLSAFLEATLRGKRDYVPLFRDHRAGAAWLPPGVYVNQLRDSELEVISDYQEDVDVATTSVPGGTLEAGNLETWREETLPLRAKAHPMAGGQATNVVRLAWEKGPSEAPAWYRITLPERAAQGLDATSHLAFALGNASAEGVPDMAIEVATDQGEKALAPISRFGPAWPPLRTRFLKLNWLEAKWVKPAEIVSQTFDVPLGELLKENPRVDPSRIRQITFVFRRDMAGEVTLDDVGVHR